VQYAVIAVSGLVMTVLGPFKTKGAANQWAESQALKGYVVVPIIFPGEVDGGVT
jgi:hypothetical protein